MIKVIGFRGREMEIKTATDNGIVYARHQDLQSLAEADDIVVYYDSLGVDDANAYAMCAASYENIISCGMAVAPTMKQAFSLAFDERWKATGICLQRGIRYDKLRKYSCAVRTHR